MIVYLDKNDRQTHGLAVRFPYDPDSVNLIKAVPGLNWDRAQKAWVSDGPEVLLDMQRFGIKISDTSSEARRIAEQFRQELWDIMDARSIEGTEEYAYQHQGTEILSVSPRFLLGDEMGLGKTKQVIDAIAKLDLESVLVLAPKTIAYNWIPEILKWHPEISAGVVPDQRKDTKPNKRNGAPGKIGRDGFWEDPPRIVIANYEKILTEDWPVGRHWSCLVADEATRLKNSTTATWKRVRAIAKQSQRFWPLTGTPLENRLMELYNIFGILRPSVLGNYIRFKNQHMVTDWSGNVIGAKNLDLLRERIGPFMLRRTKAEVLKQLPPKVFTQIYVKTTPAEQGAYQKLLTDDKDPLLRTIRLRQFAASPVLIEDDAFKKAVSGIIRRGSKYEALVELLQNHDGHAVVFCFFEEMTALLARWLEQDVGYNTNAYISGKIRAEERIARARDFDAGKLGNVFLTTDAGQQGINLISADLVVHYDQLWNPQKMHQREDRSHRIGQKSSLTVVDLLLMDTIDVGMWDLNREREKLFEEVIEGAEEAMIRKLSPARLRRIMEGKRIGVANE